MKRGSREIGRKYETAAAVFLKRSGYNIIGANYNTRYGEIDIIAEDGEYLVFVEVKYRSTDKYGSPCEFVDRKKQLRVIRAAKHYAAAHELYDRDMRFDVVEILGNKIRVIKDAFPVREA